MDAGCRLGIGQKYKADTARAIETHCTSDTRVRMMCKGGKMLLIENSNFDRGRQGGRFNSCVLRENPVDTVIHNPLASAFVV